jgi:endonuclease/exonuclease/phosphatase family metal-dependent hydrolase
MVNYTSLRARPGETAKERTFKLTTVERLKALRAGLDAHFEAQGTTAHAHPDCIRLASWNLREFDNAKYGFRTRDALIFIAEIMARFDIIAVQEVNKDLRALKDLLRIMGPDWTFLATDQAPKGRGNAERFAFVYNTKRVRSTLIAGEVTLSGKDRLMLPHSFDYLPDAGLVVELPDGADLTHPEQVYSRKERGRTTRKLSEDAEVDLPPGTKLHLTQGGTLVFRSGHRISAEKEIDLGSGALRSYGDAVGLRLPTEEMEADEQQFARPPFFATFQAGWLKLALCTVHIYYGDEREGSAAMQTRIREIERIAKALGDRAEEENDSDSDSFFFVLGDFNIVGKSHDTMAALQSNGFEIPPEIQQIPEGTNVKRDKFYDQIAYWAKTPRRLRQGIRDYARIEADAAGVFDFFDHVFTTDQAGSYAPVIKDEKARLNRARAREGKAPLTSDWDYEDWRTYQMSDHLPMWIELRTDFADAYLDTLLDVDDDDA